jgi:hypothetical protein
MENFEIHPSVLSAPSMNSGRYGDGPPSFHDTIDIDYSLNSFNYRSSEFYPPKELLVAGCSVTFGVGLPEKYMWGNFLAKNLGVSGYSNLGIPGDPIESSVFRVIKYIQNFGAPKYLAFLAPDPYRYVAIAGENDRPYHLARPGETLPRLSKAPHDPSEVLLGENALYSAVRALITLEVLCQTSGIKLAWGTWSEHTKNLISKMTDYPFYSYIDYLDYGTMCRYHMGGYEPEDDIESIVFTTAADRRTGNNGHYGSNYHRALADVIASRLEK